MRCVKGEEVRHCFLEAFILLQSKVAELDSRLSSVAQDKVKVQEQIKVLRANADKFNPPKVASTEQCR